MRQQQQQRVCVRVDPGADLSSLLSRRPYPYTSAKQYNAAREQPLGREWNTLTQNQRLTMPKVLATKPGAIIKPIQRV